MRGNERFLTNFARKGKQKKNEIELDYRDHDTQSFEARKKRQNSENYGTANVAKQKKCRTIMRHDF